MRVGADETLHVAQVGFLHLLEALRGKGGNDVPKMSPRTPGVSLGGGWKVPKELACPQTGALNRGATSPSATTPMDARPAAWAHGWGPARPQGWVTPGWGTHPQGHVHRGQDPPEDTSPRTGPPQGVGGGRTMAESSILCSKSARAALYLSTARRSASPAFLDFSSAWGRNGGCQRGGGTGDEFFN